MTRCHLVTSKASTATWALPVRNQGIAAPAPVTVITSVCVTPGARPEAENTTSEVRLPVAPGPEVSTTLGTPPSMDTAAIPQVLHLTPIQFTAVPVKAKVAVAAV